MHAMLCFYFVFLLGVSYSGLCHVLLSYCIVSCCNMLLAICIMQFLWRVLRYKVALFGLCYCFVILYPFDLKFFSFIFIQKRTLNAQTLFFGSKIMGGLCAWQSNSLRRLVIPLKHF